MYEKGLFHFLINHLFLFNSSKYIIIAIDYLRWAKLRAERKQNGTAAKAANGKRRTPSGKSDITEEEEEEAVLENGDTEKMEVDGEAAEEEEEETKEEKEKKKAAKARAVDRASIQVCWD